VLLQNDPPLFCQFHLERAFGPVLNSAISFVIEHHAMTETKTNNDNERNVIKIYFIDYYFIVLLPSFFI
jgi:hypothetical protein